MTFPSTRNYKRLSVDGTNVQVAFTIGPQQYLEGGRWRDIKPNLVSVSANAWLSSESHVGLAVPKRADGSLRYIYGDIIMTLTPLGVSLSDGFLTSPTNVRYADAYGGGSSLEYDLFGNGIRKIITFDNAING